MNDRSLYLFAFRILGDFGVSIAVPAILAAITGKWLDGVLHTTPWLLVTLLVLAFALTAVMVSRKARKYGKEYQELISQGRGSKDAE